MSQLNRLVWLAFVSGAVTATTIGVGLLVWLRPEMAPWRVWITPLCVLSAMSALLVGRSRRAFYPPSRN